MKSAGAGATRPHVVMNSMPLQAGEPMNIRDRECELVALTA